jgi:hypothetical protein
MLPALWPIQRTQPRPCTYPFALVDPPKRLTSPMPFICNKFDLTPVQSQVRTNKHICTQPHPQAHTHKRVHRHDTQTHGCTNANAPKNTQTHKRNTRNTHAHKHAHGHERHNRGTQQMPTHTHKHALKHDMHSNTPAQHLKFRSQTPPHRHHTPNTHRHAHAGWVGGGACPSGSMHVVTLVGLCVCVLLPSRCCATHTQTRPHEKKHVCLGACSRDFAAARCLGRPAGGRKNPGKPQTGRSTFLAPKLVGPSESIYKGTGPAGKKKYAH